MYYDTLKEHERYIFKYRAQKLSFPKRMLSRIYDKIYYSLSLSGAGGMR